MNQSPPPIKQSLRLKARAIARFHNNQISEETILAGLLDQKAIYRASIEAWAHAKFERRRTTPRNP